MSAGPFADFAHDHRFESRDGGTVMQDEVRFRSPLGFLGGLVDRFILEPYLRRLLRSRNQALKLAAELPAHEAGTNGPPRA